MNKATILWWNDKWKRRNNHRWYGFFESCGMNILANTFRCFLKNIESDKIENSDDMTLNTSYLTKKMNLAIWPDIMKHSLHEN
jgi:hypothetical protein